MVQKIILHNPEIAKSRKSRFGKKTTKIGEIRIK